MPTVSQELTRIQARLHDSGTLWPQAELLRWYNEGYRQLLSQSGAAVRIYVHDVPGRFSYTGTQEWEDQYTSNGLFQNVGRNAAKGNGRSGVLLWEVEQLEGITPTTSSNAMTQLWERSLATSTDRHFRFALAANHDHIRRVAWDDEALSGTHVDNMDLMDSSWWREEGEPLYWLKGTGRDKSIEVFTVVTEYNEQYTLERYEQGMAREFEGTRSYSVETDQREFTWSYTTSGDGDYLADSDDDVIYHAIKLTKKPTLSTDAHGCFVWERSTIDDIANATSNTTDATAGELLPTYWWEGVSGGEGPEFFQVASDATTYVSALDPGLGIARYATSADRQYLAVVNESGQEHYGIPRDYRSTANSLSIWEAIIPNRDLTTADTPGLIPTQMFKYIRYYVWYRAFGHAGEGQRTDLSDHYKARFDTGVMFLAQLKDVSYRDHVYARKEISGLGEPRLPRVRLPAEFPRIW